MNFPDEQIREHIERLLGRDIGAEQGRTDSFEDFAENDLDDIRKVAQDHFVYGVLYAMYRSRGRPGISASKQFCEDLLRPLRADQA